jgi:hypothetical protein
VPTNSGLLSLDEDGTACSADYYLRLTNDGGRMLKKQIALTNVRPTSPTGGTSSTPPPTGGSTGGGSGTLNANQQMGINAPIKSSDGRFDLVLGGDGNLVLYEGSTALWSAGTQGKASSYVIMQGDGNLVIYSTSGSPLWSSGTAGNSGAYLLLQDDGNMVIYSASGSVLWSTGTAGH